jgi:hypothetical protein
MGATDTGNQEDEGHAVWRGVAFGGCGLRSAEAGVQHRGKRGCR